MSTSTFCLLLLCLPAIIYSSTPYYAQCNTTGTCALGDTTARLELYKKGSTTPFSTASYDSNFFVCEQGIYYCGYMNYNTSYISVGKGISLNVSEAELVAAGVASSSISVLKGFVNVSGAAAEKLLKEAPIQLTTSQIDSVATALRSYTFNQLYTKYQNEKPATSSSWADLNFNIKTAIYSSYYDKSFSQTDYYKNVFWPALINNDWTNIAKYLENSYQQTKQRMRLLESYMINSTLATCNKPYSISFLVDESGSIKSGPFQLALQFLVSYFTNSHPIPEQSCIHFFDSSFEPYLYFNNNLSTILDKIPKKVYRAKGTYTGAAITEMTKLMTDGSIRSGLPKIMAVLTDGGSYDDVVAPSDAARAKGITMIAIGIGSGVNTTQLTQIAGTSTNVITISGYSELDKLVDFIEKYFCMQHLSITLDESTPAESITPDSPNYYQITIDPTVTTNITVVTTSTTNTTPTTTTVAPVVYVSPVDPYPDVYSNVAPSDVVEEETVTTIYYPPTVKTARRLLATQSQTIYLAVGGNYITYNIKVQSCANCPVTDSSSSPSNNNSNNSNNSNNNNGNNGNTNNPTNPIIDVLDTANNSQYGIIFGVLGSVIFVLFLGGFVYLLKKNAEMEDRMATTRFQSTKEDHQIISEESIYGYAIREQK